MLVPVLSTDSLKRAAGRFLWISLLLGLSSALSARDEAIREGDDAEDVLSEHPAPEAAESVATLAPGEKLFYICAGCHTLDADEPVGVGPHLGDILGRPFAGVEAFEYSDAMRARGRDGLVWNTETLDQYLRDPQGFVIGTSMSFQGLPDKTDRATLIAWLADNGSTRTFRYREEVAVLDNQRIVGILNIAADPDYGEYLGGECVACHQRSQQSGGVPRIHGLTAAYFIDAMLQYKEGTRSNPVMQTIASSLGDADLASLARYFEQQH